jgi:hypothetical protein
VRSIDSAASKPATCPPPVPVLVWDDLPVTAVCVADIYFNSPFPYSFYAYVFWFQQADPAANKRGPDLPG